MNIGVVIWSLFETRGGLERAGRDLARAMLERGHGVSVFCKKIRKAGAPAYTLPDGIEPIPLSLDYDTTDITAARQAIVERKPDVLVAMFSWESLLWFPALLKGTGIRLIVSEHSEPERINSKWNRYERHACLLAADGIHVLTAGYAGEYPAPARDRIMVIPNPVCLPEPERSRDENKARRTLLAMGRFDDGVKQYSLLLRAFALLREEFSGWDLELCGDGKDFAAYRKLAAQLGLEDRVRMPGMVDDVAERYQAADLVCVPSRVEGLPMALLEGFHFSLPAVGFAACSGVNAIIRHNENGLLAEEMTPRSLADSLACLMHDPALRERMGRAGKKAMAAYAPEMIYARWEELLRRSLERKQSRLEEALRDGRRDEHRLPLGELLARKHPFDRSACIALHAEAVRDKRTSLFTARQIAGFVRKQKKFGFSGLHAPLASARRFLRRILP